ncbi:hypothetical protein GCM10022276_16590 [Sphingomonas limnosediminicola]|uniref:Lipoprotein n=1 Tax=Sphingomonas limnosediminicola TaxID=940133 RepID=A0ABP7LFB5_9SPHN
MRGFSLLLLGAALGSCAAVPGSSDQSARSAKMERRFQELTANKVAQPSVNCLPAYRSSANDMTVIDDRTVVFQQNSSRVYVAHMQGSCPNIGVGPYALVTHQVGTASICRGDIADVVDTMARTTVGSCVFGDFTPYVRPGA